MNWPDVWEDEDKEIEAIREHLLSENQRQWLDRNRLTVRDVLLGFYEPEHQNAVKAVFNAWNARIGRKVFGW